MKILAIVEESISGKSSALVTDPPLTDEIMVEFNRDRHDRPEEQLRQKNGCLIVPNHRLAAWEKEGYIGEKLTELLASLLTRAETTVDELKNNAAAAKERRKGEMEKAFGLPVKPHSEFLPKASEETVTA